MKIRLALALSLAVLFLYLPPATLLTDLPRSLSLAVSLAPWMWDWPRLLWTGLHASVLLVMLAALGGRLEGWGIMRGMPAWESLVPGTAIGLAVTGFLVLGLGLAGLIQSRVLLAVYSALAVNAFLYFFVKGHPLTDEMLALLARRRIRVPGGDGLGRVEKILLLLVAGWAGMFVCADLLVPEGFWDALVYHLASPRRWMEAHKMTSVAPFFSNFPVLMPMNYMLALAVRGEGLARGLNVLLGLLTALAAWLSARIWLDRASAVRTAFIAGTSPLLLLLSVHAGADTGSALMGVLAVGMFIRAFPAWPSGRPINSFLFLSGLFAGLAYCVKPHGLVVVVVLALMLAPAWRSIPAFLAPASAVCLPWMARAFLQTGDPLFPLLGMFSGSPFWTEFSRRAYSEELIAIWRQFSWDDLVNWGWYSDLVSRYKLGLAGPAALLGAWLAVLSPPRRGASAILLVFCGLLGFAWVFTVPAWRFYAAGFALLPALLFLKPGISRVLAWTIMALQAVWWPIVVAEVDRPWDAARGRESREAYYASLHVNPSLDAFSFIEKRLAPGPRNRTLSTGEVRGFLAPPWTITASYFEEAPFLRMAVDSPDSRRLAIRLHQVGVRYLLINVPEMLRLSLDQRLCWDRPFPRALLEEFFRKRTDIVYARKSAWVYEISGKPAGAVVPECFLVTRDQATISSITASGMSSMAVARKDFQKALVFAYSAVSSSPHSGMAWAMLGDALYTNGRFREAVSSYRRALESGWRTSSVYRNQAVCFMVLRQPLGAQTAMAYAIQLDPYAMQLRQEFDLTQQRLTQTVRKYLGER